MQLPLQPSTITWSDYHPTEITIRLIIRSTHRTLTIHQFEEPSSHSTSLTIISKLRLSKSWLSNNQVNHHLNSLPEYLISELHALYIDVQLFTIIPHSTSETYYLFFIFKVEDRSSDSGLLITLTSWTTELNIAIIIWHNVLFSLHKYLNKCMNYLPHCFVD